MKKFYLLICFLLCFSFCLTGCGNDGLIGFNPNASDIVIGNGGSAVIKGEYLYFVNGYADSSMYNNISKNKFGEVTKGGIYKTKLNASGNLQKDEDGFLNYCELVVPKIVGFDNGGFFILDDYIYYTTPHMEKDSSGTLQNSWVDFCKIRIDGKKSTNTVLYNTKQNVSKLNWAVYKDCDKVYMGIKEVNQSSEILINIINTENKQVVTTLNNISSAELLEKGYTSNADALNENEKYIYYTRSVKEEDNVGLTFSGNILCRVEMGTNDEEVLLKGGDNGDETYTIINLKPGTLYYKITTSSSLGTVTNLYAINAQNIFNTSNKVTLTTGNYSSFYVIEKSILNGNSYEYVIAFKGTNVYLIVNGDESNRKKISSEDITILNIVGNNIYYTKNEQNNDGNTVTNLYVTDIKGEIENNVIKSNKLNLSSVKEYKYDTLFDTDGRRVFVLTKYTSSDDKTSYYINIIDTLSLDLTSKFVGVFDDADKPDRPKDNDETEDIDESIPWVD